MCLSVSVLDQDGHTARNKMNKGKNTVRCLVQLVRIFTKFFGDYPDARVRLSSINYRWDSTVGRLGGLATFSMHSKACCV